MEMTELHNVTVESRQPMFMLFSYWQPWIITNYREIGMLSYREELQRYWRVAVYCNVAQEWLLRV